MDGPISELGGIDHIVYPVPVKQLIKYIFVTHTYQYAVHLQIHV